ncbi:hypothetical protein D9615_000668 [Tricholomella constricta]|uniref:Uncharacterized protein n=1 Tax=Tricholomella constricta TaxID=117010 RepID=A0A8H5HR16_9AGAR|nr:hypothetical protein D9615_000668 [Tricholomella constricta]
MSSGAPNPNANSPKLQRGPSPPPYTENVTESPNHPPPEPQSTAPARLPPAGPQNFSRHQHYLFGPTPLSTQPLVPYAYYDPRSPYSMTQADARARRRFILGVFWALMTWSLIGFLVGAEAMAYASRRGNEGP